MEYRLQMLWKNLDDACGWLDNAIINANNLEGIPQDVIDRINAIDFSAIVSVKNEIEEIIEKNES